MSLDIIAYDFKKSKERKNEFKEKYNLSVEDFDGEMFEPSDNDFFYFLHPEFLKNDTKKYEEMEKDAEKAQDFDEVDCFHIGDGHFDFLKRELGELVGIEYDDRDFMNTRIIYDNKLEGTALIGFFLHPECDGSFSSDDVQTSYKQFLELCDEKKLKDKKNDKLEKEISGFLNFWENSAEQKLQWDFC
ncbi:hypothetical protein [uncultured Lactobacillus sp.]|uniref:hypothetical protein n=1 Tax=uncultured Lactobacillus sp. TaxID=153152 RepID=UPI0026085314|nr:hypothetical protein [uncultured Lactobacillus sp.]